jgi:predicted aldo/keto reductase-like oxidoreductase
MESMTLGKTGLRTQRLGFGGIPIQRLPQEEAVKVVLHAIEAGIDFIDTSRMYGPSEQMIGLALRKTSKTPIIASKTPKKTADEARAELETSLITLGLDYIDLYQCHFVRDAEDYKGIIGPGGALEGLRQARDEGLIGHIGLTAHSLELLHQVVDDGEFETIMTCFGILEPKSRESLIPKALEKNIGVMAMKPFAGGMIDRAELALKFTLSQPGVLVLAGVDDISLFDQNWQIFNSGDWELTPQELQEIDDLQKRFEKNFCRRCDYCQPCPEEIPIQMVLGLPSMVKRMGAGLAQKEHVQDWLSKAKGCQKCGECESRCPYDLPIMELLEERIDWLEGLLENR